MDFVCLLIRPPMKSYRTHWQTMPSQTGLCAPIQRKLTSVDNPILGLPLVGSKNTCLLGVSGTDFREIYILLGTAMNYCTACTLQAEIV